MALILVVDDEPDMLNLLVTLLESATSHKIMAASSPTIALEMAASATPDLLVTDYQMPQMTGIELARRLKAKSPTLKVILDTAFADSTLGQTAVEDKVVDVVCRKSIEPHKFLELVNQLVGM